MPDSNGNWNTADLVAIKTAIASGALKVEYNDRTVTYRSIDQLKQARQLIEKELGLVKRGGRLLCKSSKGTT